MTKRDPSLHIKKSQLIKVLRKKNLLNTNNIEEIVNDLFYSCKAHSVSSRSFTVSDEKLEKRLKKLEQSSRVDAAEFEKLIYAIRVQRRHRGITRINLNSRDWGVLKEITSNALSFCSDFNLDNKEGCKTYINLALDKAKVFRLNTIKLLHEKICITYEAMVEIDSDDDPDSTFELYQAYNKIVMDNTGIFDDFSKVYEKYVWFVRAKNQARDLNVAVDLYVEAQFDALGFANGIPSPSQLVGEYATSRLTKYLYKNNLKIDRN